MTSQFETICPNGTPVGPATDRRRLSDRPAGLHSNAAGVILLVEVLCDKGMPMGTLLAFMMSVVALSQPR